MFWLSNFPLNPFLGRRGLQVAENDSPCFNGRAPIWIDVKDDPQRMEKAIKKLKECTSMFSKTQKCILYDLNFELLETVKTFWGDNETIKHFGTYTGCENEAIFFIN